MLFALEDIHAKLLSHDFPFIEYFSLKLMFTKRNGALLRTFIKVLLELFNKSLDIFASKYDNAILLGDFNASVDDEITTAYCNVCSLRHLIKSDEP